MASKGSGVVILDTDPNETVDLQDALHPADYRASCSIHNGYCVLSGEADVHVPRAGEGVRIEEGSLANERQAAPCRVPDCSSAASTRSNAATTSGSNAVPLSATMMLATRARGMASRYGRADRNAS